MPCRDGGPYQAPLPFPWRRSNPRFTKSPNRVFTVGRGAPVSFSASPVVMRPRRRASSRILIASGCRPSAPGSRAIFSASRSFCFLRERKKTIATARNRARRGSTFPGSAEASDGSLFILVNYALPRTVNRSISGEIFSPAALIRYPFTYPFRSMNIHIYPFR